MGPTPAACLEVTSGGQSPLPAPLGGETEQLIFRRGLETWSLGLLRDWAIVGFQPGDLPRGRRDIQGPHPFGQRSPETCRASSSPVNSVPIFPASTPVRYFGLRLCSVRRSFLPGPVFSRVFHSGRECRDLTQSGCTRSQSPEYSNLMGERKK